MIDALHRLVADRLGVDPCAVMGRTHRAPIVKARHWAWWLLVRRHGWTLAGLGRELGRDDTTIRHAVVKCDRLIRRGDVPAELADVIAPEGKL